MICKKQVAAQFFPAPEERDLDGSRRFARDPGDFGDRFHVPIAEEEDLPLLRPEREHEPGHEIPEKHFGLGRRVSGRENVRQFVETPVRFPAPALVRFSHAEPVEGDVAGHGGQIRAELPGRVRGNGLPRPQPRVADAFLGVFPRTEDVFGDPQTGRAVFPFTFRDGLLVPGMEQRENVPLVHPSPSFPEKSAPINHRRIFARRGYGKIEIC